MVQQEVVVLWVELGGESCYNLIIMPQEKGATKKG